MFSHARPAATTFSFAPSLEPRLLYPSAWAGLHLAGAPTAFLSPIPFSLACWSVPDFLQHPIFSFSHSVVLVAATASHRRQSSPPGGQRPARLSIALPPRVKGSGGHQGTRGMKIIAWSVCTVVRALSLVHQGHGRGSPRTHTPRPAAVASCAMEPSNGVISQHTVDAELRIGVRMVLSPTEAAQLGLARRALLPGGRGLESVALDGARGGQWWSHEWRRLLALLLVGQQGLSHLGLDSPLSGMKYRKRGLFSRGRPVPPPSSPSILLGRHNSLALISAARC